VEVLQSIWKDFEKRIDMLKGSSDDKTPLLIHMDKKGSVVFISGPSQAVEERVHELTKIKDELDEKLRVSNLKITEFVAAKPHQIELFKYDSAHNFVLILMVGHLTLA